MDSWPMTLWHKDFQRFVARGGLVQELPTKTSRLCLGIFRKIEVDKHIDEVRTPWAKHDFLKYELINIVQNIHL